MPLTNTAIRNAKPGNKPIRLFDERGLYLEVSPTGGKWWRLKFRFEGKEKRLSLGVYYQRENPRLCRGGSSSLTFSGVHPETLQREPPSTRRESWLSKIGQGFKWKFCSPAALRWL
jgi:hypothetical protein